MFDHVPGMIEHLLRSQRSDYGVLACGWLPLDVDTFAMDNGGTAKEGMGHTYAWGGRVLPTGCLPRCALLLPGAGAAPGRAALRARDRLKPGACDPHGPAPERGGAEAPILARLDSGFDSAALMRSIEACNHAGNPGEQTQASPRMN